MTCIYYKQNIQRPFNGSDLTTSFFFVENVVGILVSFLEKEKCKFVHRHINDVVGKQQCDIGVQCVPPIKAL